MEIKQNIEKANEEAVYRLTSGEPVLVDIAPAGEVIPGMKDKMITHAGPPIEWENMCGAQRGSIIGSVLYEGWAESAEEAKALLQKGDIQLEPNHHHQDLLFWFPQGFFLILLLFYLGCSTHICKSNHILLPLVLKIWVHY